ncbi:MAG: 3,4-dihydroxy-2-butanone-4-phosphate synthase, partial [Ectothiorhodospiraceae bacterium]|nr:3,4-dihydroxy-2-butanone-4-phosphate synthase [Ectothiorhodospiraceae bacterium]
MSEVTPIFGPPKFDTIEEAISDVREGKMVIIVDDEDRENEGDFVCAAEKATPELVNRMITVGRGMVCVSITEERMKTLGLEMMVESNTSLHGTNFTITVDYIHGTTTGISAADRAATIQALANPETRSEDLARPGHIFPLKAMRGGVLRRAGHTEASADLSRLAGFEPCGVLCEILNDDGTMARGPQLKEIAEKFGMKMISVKDLIAYRVQNENLIKKVTVTRLPTRYGEFNVHMYESILDHKEHLAIVKGEVDAETPI